MYNIGDIFYNDDEYIKRADFCNKNGLVIVEIDKDENGRRFQIQKVPDTSEKELKQNRIDELHSLLDKTDYIVTKLAEMKISNNDNFSSELARYQDTIQNRVAWRSELDRLLNE